MLKKLFVLVGVLATAGIATADWPMCGANPQRTSSVTEGVSGSLGAAWYRPIEPFINYKIQVIAADNKLFMSTARGLYCFNAADGAQLWVHATQIPLGHSPAYYNGKIYVGSFDRTIHCLDASTGQKVSGWNPAVALAGFETNPLVVNAGQGVRVYAGNRDGFFYCLDANSGALIWKYKTGAPIKYSAAMDSNNVIYFASDDLYAYAVRDNGVNCQQVWMSSKLLGESFNIFWPVVYRNWVIFTGSEASFWANIGIQTSDGYIGINLGHSDNEINTDLTAAKGNVQGDWATGTVTINASPVCEYYENKPNRRRVFMLNRSDGKEYTFDSDNDGKAEYIPFTGGAGAKGAGSKYPPIVGNEPNGGILYDNTYLKSGWIPICAPSGWKEGTKYLSLVSKDNGFAGDEPNGYSIGGKMIYTILCCDREAYGHDLTVPFGQSNRGWTYWIYNGRFTLMPNYEPMFNNDNNGGFAQMDGWGLYGYTDAAPQAIYGKHGSGQNPWIPYKGKLFHQMGNCLVALSPAGNSTTPLPMATIQQVTDTVPPVSVTDLTNRLEEEVQKMVSSGHLKPGLTKAGEGMALAGNLSSGADMDHGCEYFCNPADTVYTLVKALPYLSSALQQQTSAYIKNEMANYPIDSITHVGFTDGAWRQPGVIEPEVVSFYNSYGKQTSVQGNWPWNFPMTSFYSAWKYSQMWPSEAGRLYNSMKTKLTLPCPLTDNNLLQSTQMLNAYLAGYKGFLNLQVLAKMDTVDVTLRTQVTNEYNRLLSMRVNNFYFDYPHKPVSAAGADYGLNMFVGRQFLYLVPEVAQELRNQNISQVQNCLNRTNYLVPGWFVSKYDTTIYENTCQHLYDTTIFNAYSMILQSSYQELLKYLDAPAFPAGDLFYIQNLAMTIEAGMATSITPVKLALSADPGAIPADGINISTITARLCDSNNNVAWNSSALVTFSLSGNAGGSLIGTNPAQANWGVATIMYKSGTGAGTATITGTSAGLTQGSVNVVTSVNNPPSATALKADGQANPAGLSNTKPDLSWTFTDPDAGQVQSAYRLLAADSQANIDNNNGNMWDTGKTISLSNTVKYNGAALLSGRTYYWKAMLWDNFDMAGAYSQPAILGIRTNTAPLAPISLLCNGQSNPAGVTNFYPNFSWGFSDPDSGDSQTAYRLIIADSQSNINSNTGNMLDTGKVNSTLSMAAYAGPTLQVGATYYWKVQLWDLFDAAGPFSGSGTFSMTTVKPSYALEFNGTNNYVDCGSGNSLDINSANASGLTVEMWIYRKSYSGTESGCLFGKIGSGGSGGYWLGIHPGNVLGISTRINGSLDGIDSTMILSSGAWHHIAYVVDGTTSRGKMFIDGKDAGAPQIQLRMPTTDSGNAYICLDNTSWNSFPGHVMVDEVRVSNIARYTGNFTVPASPFNNDANTKGLWHLDEGQGTSTVDDSGNSNTGALTNGPVWVVGYFVGGQAQPSITVTRPNGGETWTIGGQATITWASANVAGNVNIDLSTNGGTSWVSLSANSANDGIEAANVPGTASAQCRVKLSAVSGSTIDISDNNFTIQAPPAASITVLNPNGGETWTQGTINTVTWTSISVTNNVDIEISYNGVSGPWSALAGNTANDGVQSVTVPTILGTACRIRVKDVSGSPYDYSDNNFTISNIPQPILTVDKTSINFGSITQGQTGANTFNITNTGAGTLTGAITSAAAWITVNPQQFQISNSTFQIVVNINTTGLTTGTNTGTVTVTTNGGTATVNITVNVTQSSAQPQITISSSTLSFGELEVGAVSRAQALTITNSGGGALTGAITSVNSWIRIDNTSFIIAGGASQPLNVTVDNSVLSQKSGPAKGEITITSNGNNGAQVTTTISVEFTATCVLVKPNPVRLSSPLAGEGKGEGSIIFFGDGIVLGKTEIKIYTLSGELIAVLPTPAGMISTLEKSAGAGTDGEIAWQPTDLSPGIYVYVYESPKEKGVGKFTVVR